MNELWYVLLICIAVAVPISFLLHSYVRRAWQIRHSTDHQYDYKPFPETTFEDQIKLAGMKPEQTMIFGQNSFAYDRDKGKLLVRSKDVPEGVLLHSRDVLSYTLLRDGQAVAERFREGGEGITAAANLSSDCERIELRVETKHKDYPHLTMVLIPFRFERAEARDSAMDAARRIAEALDGVLGER